MARFTNKDPSALTLHQAIAHEKKRMTERRRHARQARELAAQGRGSDTEIAHVTPGEIVLPEALQTPAVLNALRQAARDAHIPFDRLRIGSTSNSVNPETGVPEFDEAQITYGPIEEIVVTGRVPTAPPTLLNKQSKFLDALNDPVTRMADKYGLDPNNVLGLTALEGKWFEDPDAIRKNNPFGVNYPGTKTLRQFNDLDDAFDYWGKVFGEQLRGTNTTREFVHGLRHSLRAGPYNSENPRYDLDLRDTIDSIRIKRPIWQQGR